MKKPLIFTVILLNIILFGCKSLNMGYRYSEKAYLPVNAVTDCIRIDSLKGYYDENSQIIAEFILTDSTGRKIYFAGDYAKNQDIWCYVADSVEGENSVLSKQDFDIREDIDTVKSSHAVGLIMDLSGSTGEIGAIQEQNAVSKLLDKKWEDDGFFIVKFDKEAHLETTLSKDNELLKKSFSRYGLGNYGKATNICAAIDKALDHMETAKNYDNRELFILSDGKNNRFSPGLAKTLERARRDHVKIFTIAYGNDVNEKYLHNIAEQTGGDYYKIAYTDKYPESVYDIYFRLHVFQVKYYLTFRPENFDIAHYVILKVCLPDCEAKGMVKVVPQVNDILRLNIKFKVDSKNIDDDPTSRKQIDKVAAYLFENPTVRIRLEGHSDCNGDSTYNMKLSFDRAEVVKQALVAKGVAGSRIETKGYGYNKPYVITINDSKKYGFPIGKRLDCYYIRNELAGIAQKNAHQLNRRTQLVVLEK